MKKNFYFILAILIIACTIMGYIDFIISPDYYIKAIAKLILFLGLPTLYFLVNKDTEIKNLFIFNKGQIKFLIILGSSIFTLILGVYFLLGSLFDLSNITKSLDSDIGVNKGNFVFVAFYIAIVNSFLEEFFFRGFAFLEMRKVKSGSFPMIISALFFALYHIAMMINWFNIGLLLLITFALFIGGIIFNLLNERFNNIYASWIVHMFANLAINLIGFILFGII